MAPWDQVIVGLPLSKMASRIYKENKLGEDNRAVFTTQTKLKWKSRQDETIITSNVEGLTQN